MTRKPVLRAEAGMRECACIAHTKQVRNDSIEFELELELIPTQLTQKPMLRAEVYTCALRASQNRRG